MGKPVLGWVDTRSGCCDFGGTGEGARERLREQFASAVSCGWGLPWPVGSPGKEERGCVGQGGVHAVCRVQSGGRDLHERCLVGAGRVMQRRRELVFGEGPVGCQNP